MLRDFAAHIEEFIDGGRLKLSPEILGGFNFLQNSLFANLNLDKLAYAELNDAKVEYQEGLGGIAGEAGREASVDGALTSNKNSKVVLTGLLDLFSIESVTLNASFVAPKGKPNCLLQFSLPVEQENQPTAWGIGEVFPDVPLIRAINISCPVIILASKSFGYNPVLDATVEPGFNIYGNLEIEDANDEILRFIGSMTGSKRLAFHGSAIDSDTGPSFLLEAAVRRSIPLLGEGGLIRTQKTKFELVRSDFAITFEGLDKEPKLTLGNDLRVVLHGPNNEPEDLIFSGAIELEAESTGAAWTLNGTGRSTTGQLSGEQQSLSEWRHPFGIPGIVLRQVGLAAGITYLPPHIDRLGLATNMKLGDIDGMLALQVDTNDADNFVLAGSTESITLLEIMSAMSQPTFVAYNALPQRIKSGMNQLVDVRMDNVEVSIVPAPTTIGGVIFRDAGVTIAGSLSAWGWQMWLYLNVDYYDGITAQAELDPVELLGGLFKLTGAKKTKKPHLDLRIGPTADSRLVISSRVYLLGISSELDIKADKNGLNFELTGQIAKLLKTSLQCFYADRLFKAQGSIDFLLNQNIGPIYLPGTSLVLANQISLVDIYVQATAFLQINTGHQQQDLPRFLLTLDGDFRFYGKDIRLPHLQITTSFETFSDLYELLKQYIADHAAEMFRAFFESAWKWAEGVKQGVIQFAGNVASVLKEGFNQSVEAVAEMMDYLGIDLTQISSDIKHAFDASEAVVASALKEIGHVAKEVAIAISNAFETTLELATSALHAAQYIADDVAYAIKDTFTDSIDEAAQALKQAGYLANEVAQALKGTFTNVADDMAAALKYADFAASEVAQAMNAAFTISPDELTDTLRGVGYDFGEAALAVDRAFTQDLVGVGKDIDKAFEGIGEDILDIGQDIGKEFENIGQDVVNLGEDIGQGFEQIGQEVADGLKSAGEDFFEFSKDVVDVLNPTKW